MSTTDVGLTGRDPGAVLYVENDENDVFLLRRAWTVLRLRQPLHVVVDGEAAVDYLSGTGPYIDRTRHPMPFLVLLDLHLPRLSGFDVLMWIRAQPSIETLRVVVLTGLISPNDRRRAEALGVEAYLTKSPDFSALRESIAALAASFG